MRNLHLHAGTNVGAGAGGVEVYALGLGQTGTVITDNNMVCIPIGK